MVLDSEVQGDIGNGFSLDSDQNSREIQPGEANRINSVGVGEGSRRVGNEVAMPVFQWEVSDGESSEAFMVEEKAIIGLIMALKMNGNIPAQERSIVDRIFPVDGGREHSDAGATRGWEEGDTIWAATQVSSLEKKLIRVQVRRVDEGIGEVVEVPEIDKRHIDVDVVWPHRILQVLGIKGFELRVMGRQNVLNVTSGRDHVARRITQGDEIIARRQNLITAVFFKDKLFRVLLLHIIIHELNGRQDNQAAD
jgi:hypothetical protein